jgi:hypothetical protein
MLRKLQDLQAEKVAAGFELEQYKDRVEDIEEDLAESDRELRHARYVHAA